jgi:hypothetical protein
MGTYSINSVKLLSDDHIRLNCILKEDDGTEAELPGMKHSRPAHIDLKNAFQALAPHLAIRTGCIKAKQIGNEDLINEFHVTGVIFKGDQYFRIIGVRKVEDGNVTLTTPKTYYEGENTYQLIEDCQAKLQTLREEALMYLVNGKRAPDPQLEMFAEDADNNKTPGNGSRKKVRQTADSPSGELVE